MKKLILITVTLLLSITSIAQKNKSSDIYLITKRFVGYNDKCDNNQNIKWLYPLPDNNFKVYISKDMIIIEENGEHDMIAKTDSLGYYHNEDGETVTEYYGKCDGGGCTISFRINDIKKFFHLYIFYSDWALGYELKLLSDGR